MTFQVKNLQAVAQQATPLPATFSLTPREPSYFVSQSQYARFHVYGADFFPMSGFNKTFEEQYAENRLFFAYQYATDPTLDYTKWVNRRTSRHIQLKYDLSALGSDKELALIFGFQAESESRLIVLSFGGFLSDVTLVPGDNQFLMEVESLGHIDLFFIHARLNGSVLGGDWFFKGITGYVI